jgi:hypothetical protein
MDMNENTAIWWKHVSAQDDGCFNPQGSRMSLRLGQVDVIVGEV